MTAHEEHGFPDPTFERIFCGSSFDPSLKGRHHPTFLCKFLLGTFRGQEEAEAYRKPSFFWHSVAEFSTHLLVSVETQVPYKMPVLLPATRDLTERGIAAFVRTADRGQKHTRWNQPVMAYVQDLCLRLWCGSSASFSGTKAILINC